MGTVDRFYTDILSTAVEGGINYWAQIVRVEHTTDGYSFTICEVENPGDVHTLDIPTIRKGYSMICDSTVALHVLPMWRKRVAEQIRLVPSDEEDLDAEDADMIAQIGLFGEVIYG